MQKRTYYWNIVFPGAGFAFSGDFWRFLLFGGGAMALLLTGCIGGWLALRPIGLTLSDMFQRLIIPFILLSSVVGVHLAAIFASRHARIGSPSRIRAIIYICICVFLSGLCLLLMLWEIWRQQAAL